MSSKQKRRATVAHRAMARRARPRRGRVKPHAEGLKAYVAAK